MSHEPQSSSVTPLMMDHMVVSVQSVVDQAASEGIRMSVGIADLSDTYGGGRLILGSAESYKPASTIKLAIVSALLWEVDRGIRSLDDLVTVTQDDVVGGSGSLQHEHFPQEVTLEQLACLMISESDNTATNVLIDVVQMDQIQNFIQQLGFEGMHLGRKMFHPPAVPEQENWTNTDELTKLLEYIYKGHFLNKTSCGLLISWMSDQKVKTKFGATLPGGSIAHKTGESANVTHDAGYFLIPGKETVVTVLAEVTVTEHYDEAQKLGNPYIQRIAKIIYDFLI